MKSLAALSCLIMLSLQIILKGGIFVYYQLNKDYIVANFCVNISQPELNCEGKCYLAKQLKKADGTQNPREFPQTIKRIVEFQPFIEHEAARVYPGTPISVACLYRPDALSSGAFVAIFQPPEG